MISYENIGTRVFSGWVRSVAVFPHDNLLFPPGKDQSRKLEKWRIFHSTEEKVEEKQKNNKIVLKNIDCDVQSCIELMNFNNQYLLFISSKCSRVGDKFLSVRVIIIPVNDTKRQREFKLKLELPEDMKDYEHTYKFRSWKLSHEEDLFCICFASQIYLISFSLQKVTKKYPFVLFPHYFFESKIHRNSFYCQHAAHPSEKKIIEGIVLFNYSDPDLSKFYSDIQVSSEVVLISIVKVVGEELIMVCHDRRRLSYQEREDRNHDFKDLSINYICDFYDSSDDENKQKSKVLTFDSEPMKCINQRFLFFVDGKMFDFSTEETYDFGNGLKKDISENISFRFRKRFHMIDLFIMNRQFVAVHSLTEMMYPPAHPTVYKYGMEISEVEGSEEIIFSNDGFEDLIERILFVSDQLLFMKEEEKEKKLPILMINIQNEINIIILKSFLC